MMNEAVVLAEQIKTACIEAAIKAYEDAGINGLCADGRWECAVQAIRSMDLVDLVQQLAHAIQDEEK